MTRKGWGISAIGFFAVFLIIIFGYSYVYDRLELVKLGLASPQFPYHKYTDTELEKMYPQYINVDVATTQTPEQTHAIFIEYLKAGDIDKAVECCFVGENWETQKKFFENVKEKNMWDVMVGDLSEIEKEMVLDTIATYLYGGTLNGKQIANTLSFIKNSQGVWLIDKL